MNFERVNKLYSYKIFQIYELMTFFFLVCSKQTYNDTAYHYVKIKLKSKLDISTIASNQIKTRIPCVISGFFPSSKHDKRIKQKINDAATSHQDFVPRKVGKK